MQALQIANSLASRELEELAKLRQLQLVVRGEVVLATERTLDSRTTSIQWDLDRWMDRTAKVRVLALAGSGAEGSFGMVEPIE